MSGDILLLFVLLLLISALVVPRLIDEWSFSRPGMKHEAQPKTSLKEWRKQQDEERKQRRELMRTTLQKAVVFVKQNFPKGEMSIYYKPPSMTVRSILDGEVLDRKPTNDEWPPLTLPVIVYLNAKMHTIEIDDMNTSRTVAVYYTFDYSGLEICATAAEFSEQNGSDEDDSIHFLA